MRECVPCARHPCAPSRAYLQYYTQCKPDDRHAFTRTWSFHSDPACTVSGCRIPFLSLPKNARAHTHTEPPHCPFCIWYYIIYRGPRTLGGAVFFERCRCGRLSISGHGPRKPYTGNDELFPAPTAARGHLNFARCPLGPHGNISYRWFRYNKYAYTPRRSRYVHYTRRRTR